MFSIISRSTIVVIIVIIIIIYLVLVIVKVIIEWGPFDRNFDILLLMFAINFHIEI